MKHKEAAERLYDLMFGELDERARSELESHVAECDDCRSLQETYRVLHETLQTQAGRSGDHPSPDELVSWVLEPDALMQADRERVEAHVADCPSCHEEASKVRQVELRTTEDNKVSEPAATRWRINWQRPEMRFAVAATVLAALLIYPAFVGISRQSDREGTWSGAAPLHLVTSTLRETGGAIAIHVDSEAPVVVFGVEVRIPPDIPADEHLRFEIAGQGERPAVSVDVTASEAREQIRSTGIVTLVVPSSTLRTGPHELRVTLRDDPDRAALLEVRLDVEVR